MAKHWTENEEKRLVCIVESPWSLYNYYKAAHELMRSATACKRRYWEIRERDEKEDVDAPRDAESTR